MQIKLNGKIKEDCTVYFFYGDSISNSVDKNIKVLGDKLIKSEKFKGEFGEVVHFKINEQEELKDIILAGLGKEQELTPEKISTVAAKLVKKAKELKCESIAVPFIRTKYMSFNESLFSMIEAVYLADYKFNKYKSADETGSKLKVSITGILDEEKDAADKIHNEAAILSESTIIARAFVNEPANKLTPKILAKEIRDIGEKKGFEVEVFNKDEIEELNMEAFLSVARGSDNAPRLIVMKYFGDKENMQDTIGLVGKGLTYDSGGYSIKPTDSMATMKNDMGGAAAVVGVMSALAVMKSSVNVIAVVAACENMISGSAYKPGDIIGSMAGKTIEVINTDAEGRLTLADAVYYISEKQKVSKIIDIATLTGAALVALGNTTTPVITNNQAFYNELENASKKCGEKIWQLPAFEEYKKLIKSDVADLKNTGGRMAGTITAGLFIGEFVNEKPWLHLDIAGTAWTDKENDYISKGGTGAGVRILYHMLNEGIN